MSQKLRHFATVWAEKRGCIKNKLFDTLFLYIAIESAKIFKRPIFGDFPKIFDSRGV